ncbi:hypothetical protein ACLOJK_006982 [Asimina triloba]
MLLVADAFQRWAIPRLDIGWRSGRERHFWPLISGCRDGIAAVQEACIEINDRMITGKKDVRVTAVVTGGGIGAQSDLPSPIDVAVTDVEEEEGLPLPWPKKRVVPSIGCGLDGSEIFVSLPLLWMAWIAQMCARRRWVYRG